MKAGVSLRELERDGGRGRGGSVLDGERKDETEREMKTRG